MNSGSVEINGGGITMSEMIDKDSSKMKSSKLEKLNIKKVYKRTIYSVKNFRNAPLANIAFLIPVAMFLISLVVAIVGYVIFITQGGYSVQVALIKDLGREGITRGFTLGSSGLLTSGIIANVILILFSAQFIVTLLAYFKKASKVQCIIMIVDLAVMVVILLIIPLSVLLDNLGRGIFKTDNELIIGVYYFIMEMNIDTDIMPIICAVVVAVSCIVFIVLTVINKCSWMAGHGIVSLISNFIALPLVILILENIIPLVVGILMWGFFCVIIMMMFSGTAGGSNVSSGGSGSDYNSKDEKKLNDTTSLSRGNCEYITDLNRCLGIKLYKVRGFSDNYVQLDNGVANRNLCTVDAFKKGKFHIYDAKTKKEVQFHEIPWR